MCNEINVAPSVKKKIITAQKNTKTDVRKLENIFSTSVKDQ